MVKMGEVLKFLKTAVEEWHEAERHFMTKAAQEGLAHAVEWHAEGMYCSSVRGVSAKYLLDALAENKTDLDKLSKYALKELIARATIGHIHSTSIWVNPENQARLEFWAELCQILDLDPKL